MAKQGDQMRFSEGKAKLSYPFASSRAWKKIRDSFSPANFNGESLYNDETDSSETPNVILANLYEFLGRETDDLTAVFVDTMNLLQEDLTGDTPDYRETFSGFLGDIPDALKSLCAVYEYGERKYARGNYRKGASVTSYLDSAERHLVFGYLTGERNDLESGLPHLAHVAWNLLIAMDQPASRDDRLPEVHDPANDEPLEIIDEAPFIQKLMFDWQPMLGDDRSSQKCVIGNYVLRVYEDLDIEVATVQEDLHGCNWRPSGATTMEGAKRAAETAYLLRVGAD